MPSPVGHAVAGSYVSHIAMDWLGEDPTINPGLQALWPLTDRLFMSGWDLFRSTERNEPFAPAKLAHNSRTLAQEMVILAPFLFWLVWRRMKTPRSSKGRPRTTDAIKAFDEPTSTS